jgi:hypothetical protein
VTTVESVTLVRRFERWRDVRRAMRALDALGFGYLLDATGEVYILTVTIRAESAA